MHSRWLKLVAIVTMTVDHIGYMLFPFATGFRIIGRIAFPIFAFLIAYGCTKTRNLSLYFLRLFGFGVWLQAAWLLFMPTYNMNIFFTLSLGVACIWLIEKMRFVLDRPFLCVLGAIPLICLIMGTAELARTDYGTSGVFLIILFWAGLKLLEYMRAKNFRVMATPASSVAIRALIVMTALVLFNLMYSLLYNYYGIQWYSLFAVLFLALFWDKKLKIPTWEKWAFYLYFPVHMVVLYLIQTFL